ncbi:carboxymuconolactone decarboxylase family protein [Lactobacillus sp. ESL0680]|uniref:carboxymuconolactone decarboxylase family protein n=1 Tax=Lactobacillus sp. ESL0680 TaxID=2983210 RepID=UPI0023F74B40|nr:carboxymuconolactone decarboxylase family protein [Lactobacillus sp. ESL0680]WEV39299.1 carboxymuconolactone decarboxylase family protein [Lactobacillus sp. ESL0680]
MAKKQTAGRENLGKFAPQFAALNDDVLFGQVWSKENELSAHDRSLVTIAALMAMGNTEQITTHLKIGKQHGITKEEIVAEITQLAFYVGWPKAWSTFNRAKEIWSDDVDTTEVKQPGVFATGPSNDRYVQYFVGKSYNKALVSPNGKDVTVPVSNVTFEPGCHNNWHIHHDGSQILLAVGGRGWYQEWGKQPQELNPGDVVVVHDGVKHWHGAAKDSWFSHLAITTGSTQWLEPVVNDEYNKLP